MTPVLLIPPALEPIALADAKAWLRLDATAEDDLIGVLITSARMIVEAATRRLLLTQTWRLVYDSWPGDNVLRLPLAPFQSLVAARVYDGNNVATPVSLAAATLDASPDCARLAFPGSPPMPGRAIAGVEIDLVAGYGAAPASAPEPLRQAMRMLIARWYENRGDVAMDSGAMRLPAAVAALIAPYVRARLT